MSGTPILHCDLDAFYASVEQILDPSLAGRPILVGGGVVVAASYEARAFGISAPMNVRRALERCPEAVVVSGSFREYSDYSDRVMEILRDFSPLLEQISIDEAFLDVSGTMHLLGEPAQIGREIRHRVRAETGLPISVGVASSKFLAKVASAAAKPDGLLVVNPDDEIAWLHSLPVRVIWGIGPVTERKLHERGVKSVGELAATPVDALSRWLGPGAGHHLHALAWNRDPRPVQTSRRAKSIGAQSALGRGLTDIEELSGVLLHLADRVGTRMRKKNKVGRTLTLRVRFDDMSSASRATTFDAPLNTTAAMHRAAMTLLGDARGDHDGPLTLVGISMSKLADEGAVQMELALDEGDVSHAGSIAADHQAEIDRQIDRARERFGRDVVGRASDLLNKDRRRIDDGFRKLAEKD
jgi:DNA polymerase-4